MFILMSEVPIHIHSHVQFTRKCFTEHWQIFNFKSSFSSQVSVESNTPMLLRRISLFWVKRLRIIKKHPLWLTENAFPGVRVKWLRGFWALWVIFNVEHIHSRNQAQIVYYVPYYVLLSDGWKTLLRVWTRVKHREEMFGYDLIQILICGIFQLLSSSADIDHIIIHNRNDSIWVLI